MVSETVTPRLAPLEPPFDPEVGALLESMMPAGVPPIALFRTLARHPAMAAAMRGWGAYELGRSLSLSLRQRELVIDRTCARAGCDYEWGVHVAFFAERAGLDRAQVASLASGGPADGCWTDRLDRLLLAATDQLFDAGDLDDPLWAELAGVFDDRRLLDLVVLCGWYRAVALVARVLRLAPEAGTPTVDGAAPGT